MKLVIEEKDVGLEIDLNEVRAAIRPTEKKMDYIEMANNSLNTVNSSSYVELRRMGYSQEESEKILENHPLAGINSVQRGYVPLKSGLSESLKNKPRKKPGRKPGAKKKPVVAQTVSGNGEQ